MERALCATLDEDLADKLFFPPKEGQGGRIDYTRAKEICKQCPVQRHCLMFAIAHKIPHGVWGGRTARERAHIPKVDRAAIRRAWKSGIIPDDLARREVR